MIVLGLVSVGGALVWPLVLNDPWIAYPVLFWGGVFVGIYTLMMAGLAAASRVPSWSAFTR